MLRAPKLRVFIRRRNAADKASQADLREANRRAELVRARLRGAAPADGSASERTLRLWVARYRAAETAYGAGYLGLLPQTARRGDRGRKLPEQTLNLISEFIEREYETLRQRTKYAAYALLLHHCQEQGALAPSYKTFSLEVKRRANVEQTFKRQGRRAAYQRQALGLELTTPRHGIGLLRFAILTIPRLTSNCAASIPVGRWGVRG